MTKCGNCAFRFYFGSQATRTILESIVQTERVGGILDRRWLGYRCWDDAKRWFLCIFIRFWNKITESSVYHGCSLETRTRMPKSEFSRALYPNPPWILDHPDRRVFQYHAIHLQVQVVISNLLFQLPSMVLQVGLKGIIRNVYRPLTLIDLLVTILQLLQHEIHVLHLLVSLALPKPKLLLNQESFVVPQLTYNLRLAQNVRLRVDPNFLPHAHKRGGPVWRISERQTNL